MPLRLSLVLLILGLCFTACQSVPPTPITIPTSTPIPRPNHTPTPSPAATPTSTSVPTATHSFTPAATPIVQSTEAPAQTPVPQETTAASPAAPQVIHKTGPVETLQGLTAKLVEEADNLFARGQYSEAITKYKEAQELANGPNQVIQSWLSHSYHSLGNYDQAILHFSSAIQIHDNASDRVNRASVFLYNNQCQDAMQDAGAALDMAPAIGDGSHTSAEAHLILSQCYTQGEQYALALEQIDAAIAIAEEHGFRQERMEQITLLKFDIVTLAQNHAYPEDQLSGQTSRDVDQGVGHFYEARYPEAIAAFKSAQQAHGRRSGLILTLLARSYSGMGDHDTAIRYFSEAIEVRDDAYNRTWRAIQYFNNEDCEKATDDAYVSLTKTTYAEPGFDTIVEARWITGFCDALYGRYEEALADLEEAIKLAQVNGYPPEHVSYMSDIYQEVLELKAAKSKTTP